MTLAKSKGYTTVTLFAGHTKEKKEHNPLKDKDKDKKRTPEAGENPVKQ